MNSTDTLLPIPISRYKNMIRLTSQANSSDDCCAMDENVADDSISQGDMRKSLKTSD